MAENVTFTPTRFSTLSPWNCCSRFSIPSLPGRSSPPNLEGRNEVRSSGARWTSGGKWGKAYLIRDWFTRMCLGLIPHGGHYLAVRMARDDGTWARPGCFLSTALLFCGGENKPCRRIQSWTWLLPDQKELFHVSLLYRRCNVLLGWASVWLCLVLSLRIPCPSVHLCS